MGLGSEFQPYGLPDACGTGIGTSVGIIPVALLADGLHGASGIVAGINHKMVFPFLQERRNFQCKGNIAAFMASGFRSVNKDQTLIINRAEMQINLSLQLFGSNVNSTVIPYCRNKIGIPDAAQLAFRTEGNQDFVREFRTLSEAPLQAAAVKIKCKVPCPVQVCPVLSHKLRERMLRSGHCFHKNLHSAG